MHKVVVRESRTFGTGIDPRLHEITQLLLGSGRGLASGAGLPRPSYQVIVRDVVMQQGKVSTAIVGRILDLPADFTDRFTFPCHLPGGEPPARMTWDAPIARLAGRQSEVSVSMARCAREPGHSVIVGTAQSRRLMYVMIMSLQWMVAGRMAIQATRTCEDFCNFGEHRPRTSGAIRYA